MQSEEESDGKSMALGPGTSRGHEEASDVDMAGSSDGTQRPEDGAREGSDGTTSEVDAANEDDWVYVADSDEERRPVGEPPAPEHGGDADADGGREANVRGARRTATHDPEADVLRQVRRISLKDARQAIDARTRRGSTALGGLKAVHTPRGEEGVLVVEPEVGDGFCFLRALCRQTEYAGGMEHRSLAVATLAEIAGRPGTDGPFLTGADVAAHERGIQGRTEYASVLRHTRGTPAYEGTVYVLDLLEGVLLEDWSAGRRFADQYFIQALLRLLSLRCIVWAVDGASHLLLPEARPCDVATDLAACDLFMVHHARGEHYDSVRVAGGGGWWVAESTCHRLAQVARRWPAAAWRHGADGSATRRWFAELIRKSQAHRALWARAADFGCLQVRARRRGRVKATSSERRPGREKTHARTRIVRCTTRTGRAPTDARRHRTERTSRRRVSDAPLPPRTGAPHGRIMRRPHKAHPAPRGRHCGSPGGGGRARPSWRARGGAPEHRGARGGRRGAPSMRASRILLHNG